MARERAAAAEPAAVVVPSVSPVDDRKRRYKITNRSEQDLEVTLPDGSTASLAAGKSIESAPLDSDDEAASNQRAWLANAHPQVVIEQIKEDTELQAEQPAAEEPAATSKS